MSERNDRHSTMIVRFFVFFSAKWGRTREKNIVFAS